LVDRRFFCAAIVVIVCVAVIHAVGIGVAVAVVAEAGEWIIGICHGE